MKNKSISERAIIGFDHGLPCCVKNMALGPQLRQKPRPSASVFVYWVPRAMFFTRHGRPWSNPTIHRRVWCEIAYPFPNFNVAAVEVWELISNYFLHAKPWIPVAGYRYSRLLFTSEDRICANLRVQWQSTNMTSQYQFLAFAWRHRSIVVTSQCWVRKCHPWQQWRNARW